jgi:hypothetical protein
VATVIYIHLFAREIHNLQCIKTTYKSIHSFLLETEKQNTIIYSTVFIFNRRNLKQNTDTVVSCIFFFFFYFRSGIYLMEHIKKITEFGDFKLFFETSNKHLILRLV